MKKILIAAILGLSIVLFNTAAGQTGEVDILVQKLVEKGVLTAGDAQQIITETKEEIRKDMAKGELESVPKWVQNTKLSGDFRLREQRNSRKGHEERYRTRIRYRLGIDSKVNDQFKVGAGFASGGSDPRSTNETLDNTFDTPDIRLDYAYAEYTPVTWLSMVGGKFKRKPYLWAPADLMWDGDINPEGAAVALKGELGEADTFLNTGFFIVDESSGDTSDPFMAFIQPGFSMGVADGVKLKGAVAYYDFINVKGTSLDNAAGTNTIEDSGFRTATPLMYDYNCFNTDAELGFKEPFGGVVPYAALFGEYVHNFDPDNDNNGYLAGVKFGSEKIKGFGDWQLKYMYRRLERDAWVDALPDSDAYDGASNIKGHEIVFGYGLSENVSLGLDYYYTQPINVINSGAYNYLHNPDDIEHIFQADLLFKF